MPKKRVRTNAKKYQNSALSVGVPKTGKTLRKTHVYWPSGKMQQNASYNKCVSRVRIPTPVDHVITACPKSVCEQTLKNTKIAR